MCHPWLPVLLSLALVIITRLRWCSRGSAIHKWCGVAVVGGNWDVGPGVDAHNGSIGSVGSTSDRMCLFPNRVRRGRSVGATSVTGLVCSARLLVLELCLTTMQSEKAQEPGSRTPFNSLFYIRLAPNKDIVYSFFLPFLPRAVDSICLTRWENVSCPYISPWSLRTDKPVSLWLQFYW